MVNPKRMNETVEMIQKELNESYPKLKLQVYDNIHDYLIHNCMGSIQYQFAVDEREIKQAYSFKFILRERILESLIQAHKKLRIEIERIMYGH